MAMPTALSIVIPSRLQSVELRTLRSLRDQQLEPSAFEVVVVADGAPARTVTTLREWRPSFEFRVIDQARAGQGAARNRGASAARHETLIFLDDDLSFGPNFLTAMGEALCSECDVAVGVVMTGDWVPYTQHTEETRRWQQALAERPVDELPYDAVVFQATALRRHYFESAGGFDESFTADGGYGNEDIELGWRLRTMGARIRLVPDAIAQTDLVTDIPLLLARARKIGKNDVRLVRKHPELAARSIGRRISRSKAHRNLSYALLRWPRLGLLTTPARVMASLFAGNGRRGPAARAAWKIAYALHYWRGVQEAGGRGLHPALEGP